MTLNAKALPHLKPGRHADGNGLYLTVQKRGTRSWTQVLRVSGRRLDLGLGRFPDVSLKEARRVAVRNRALAKAGVDPRRSTEERMSFATANGEYLRWRRFPEAEAGSTRSNQRYKWDRAMANHVLPAIGDVAVAELSTQEVAKIASALVSTPSAAKFAMSCIERVCGWAIDSGHREAANPASGPNRQIKVPARRHATFLPVEEVAPALDRIEASGSSLSVSLAVRFLALTAKRLVEVRRATWDQMDLEAAEWTIPGNAETKIREDHVVPLSDAALGVLERARALGNDKGVVFAGGSSGGVLADASVRRAMRDAGIAASPHGFRSTFRTWAQSRGENWEASELSLGHRVGSSVSSSYARSDMLALRRALLERYAEALGLSRAVTAARS